MRHHQYPTHITSGSSSSSISNSSSNDNDDNDNDTNDAKAVYSYFPNGNIKTYHPNIFKNIRRSITNTNSDTSNSKSNNNNNNNDISKYNEFNEKIYMKCLHYDNLNCLSSDSKSGQSFWVSNDGSIILKTIKHYELKNLLNILIDLNDHMINSKSIGYPSTIASIIGLYKVTLISGHKKYFMACRNVYPNQNINININQSKYKSIKIIKKYDLKGSTIGRRASINSNVKKDLDLMESGYLLSLGYKSKEILIQSLIRDTEFLSKHNFMDYSLLVAEVKEEVTVNNNNNNNNNSNSNSNSNSNTIKQQHHHHHHHRSNSIRRIFTNIFHRNKKDNISTSSSSSSSLSLLLDNDIIDSSGIIVLKGNNNMIYYFGIIDFLQKYSFRKVIETWIKGIYCNSNNISCVNPKYYAKRFLNFLYKFIV